MPNNWEEQISDIVFDDLKDLCGNTNCQVVVNGLKRVIKTQVIEKLIEDIPDRVPAILGSANISADIEYLKKHLKAKWLGKEPNA